MVDAIYWSLEVLFWPSNNNLIYCCRVAPQSQSGDVVQSHVCCKFPKFPCSLRMRLMLLPWRLRSVRPEIRMEGFSTRWAFDDSSYLPSRASLLLKLETSRCCAVRQGRFRDFKRWSCAITISLCTEIWGFFWMFFQISRRTQVHRIFRICEGWVHNTIGTYARHPRAMWASLCYCEVNHL